MNKRFIFSSLFILTMILSAAFINRVSANTVAIPQVSTTIVISQVYGGGGSNTGTPTYQADYIELFNLSSTAQSLNGLTLQYGSATGNFASTATNLLVLPNVTLQPGQYYLIQVGTAGTAGAPLPVTPDLVTTNLNLSGASGKVALTTSATPLGCGAAATPCTLPNPTIIDLVAYGAANNAEGGVSAGNGVALTNVQGVVRNSSCIDTDNNNADFTVTTNPVPRNSSTTAAACGTTASVATIEGRVLTNRGKAIAGAKLTLTDSQGNARSILSGRNGGFRFTDVEVGQTYVLNISSRGYRFNEPTRVLTVNEDLDGINFIAY